MLFICIPYDFTENTSHIHVYTSDFHVCTDSTADIHVYFADIYLNICAVVSVSQSVSQYVTFFVRILGK